MTPNLENLIIRAYFKHGVSIKRICTKYVVGPATVHRIVDNFHTPN